ncbi:MULTISPECIES: hypothetical protein [unclassified Coleofasciculus]|uniref:hypothetical protein n=1 Tax=unclassified Coleofasciculus TaxID=2692782 RepID=UPI001881ADED|nr:MULTISPECIES: hypothetical protein [unclassified Coleofasciculus]MBE9124894.1 hypothetical protein [Coleofasciculus sp. LEGE 07081]MBE9147862.1 hypothetical protein [Coleofasciculus sp. LEGE 07092]
MATVKHRYIGIFPNLRLVSLEWALQREEEKKRNAPRKILMKFVTPIFWGQGKKGKEKSADFAEEAEVFWKCKVTSEVYSKLKDLGLRPGCVASIRAAIDNYGSQEQGGTWFEFLELKEIDGHHLNWKSEPVEEQFNELEELESSINSELISA